MPRDGLSPAFGLDEAGQMDAMGLGWVNQFNIAGVSAMAQAANELISELAPR
jgi:hypothetical protein